MPRRSLLVAIVCACATAVAVPMVAPRGTPADEPLPAGAWQIQPGSGLPVLRRAATAEWCGTPAAEDRPPLLTGKAVHVVYAYPADASDRFAEVVGRIQGDVELLETWWRGQDSSRSLRFDLTTYPCGQQLDVTVVRLPEPASAYYALATRFDRIASALRSSGLVAPWAKYLVYVDGPVEGRVCGQGGGTPDTGPSYALVHLLGPCSELETVAAHELIHTLGVLRYATGATHACPGDPGHVCDSEQDMMYPFAGDLFTRILDVNRDDYYGHAGSWYDLQDSPWLRRPTQVRVGVTIVGAGAVRSQDPGIDCPSTCEADWDVGIPVTLQAEPAEGTRFVRWGGSCTGAFSCLLPMDAGAAVTALFAPQTYPLGIVVVGEGAVTGAALATACRGRCRYDVASFTPVRLTAKPARGWRLRGWRNGCTHARATCTLPMTRPATARAIFVRR